VNIELIKNLCGINNKDQNLDVIKSDPNFVFQPDSNFQSLNLYDVEGNAVTVNSWLECAHYVSGGWGINQPYIVNNKLIFAGIAGVIVIAYCISKFAKKVNFKRIVKTIKNSTNNVRLLSNTYIRFAFYSLLFGVQNIFIFNYVRNKSLGLKVFVDEYIVLTSNVEFFKNLNFTAGGDWGGSYSIYLTSGPISALGSVIGWNMTSNFTIARVSNFYWIYLLHTVFLLVLSRKYNFYSWKLYFLGNFTILLIPWWIGSLYSLGELASMIIFINSIFLYNKYPKTAMFLFSLSIFFGKLLTLIPFLGFYIVTLLQSKNIKKIVSNILIFMIPVFVWLLLIRNKYEKGGVYDYLQAQKTLIFTHQSSGLDLFSSLNINSIKNQILMSEFSQWNSFDKIRLLILPAIFIFLVVRNRHELTKIFGEIYLQLVTSFLFAYLWFWIFSGTKWIRYSQHFTVIMIVTVIYLLSSNTLNRNIDYLISASVLIFFIEDNKILISIFIFMASVLILLLKNQKYDSLIIMTLIIFFLINFYTPVNETRTDLVIDECVPILLDDTCKNMYFERD
jgi:hypothetical protein